MLDQFAPPQPCRFSRFGSSSTMIEPPGTFEVSWLQVGGFFVGFAGSLPPDTAYGLVAHVVAQLGIQVTGLCHQHWKSSSMQWLAPGLDWLVLFGSHWLADREHIAVKGAGCTQRCPPLYVGLA